jgi:hypothetical protein
MSDTKDIGSAKLWYQSFVDPEAQKPYIDRLQQTLDDIASPGITFEVHGLSPPDQFFHPLTEFRCAAQCIRNAIAAERAGYDAFVIGHFQEPGLIEARLDRHPGHRARRIRAAQCLHPRPEDRPRHHRPDLHSLA